MSFVRLFSVDLFVVLWVGLQCVLMVFPDHNHLHFYGLFLVYLNIT